MKVKGSHGDGLWTGIKTSRINMCGLEPENSVFELTTIDNHP